MRNFSGLVFFNYLLVQMLEALFLLLCKCRTLDNFLDYIVVFNITIYDAIGARNQERHSPWTNNILVIIGAFPVYIVEQSLSLCRNMCDVHLFSMQSFWCFDSSLTALIKMLFFFSYCDKWWATVYILISYWLLQTLRDAIKLCNNATVIKLLISVLCIFHSESCCGHFIQCTVLKTCFWHLLATDGCGLQLFWQIDCSLQVAAVCVALFFFFSGRRKLAPICFFFFFFLSNMALQRWKHCWLC